ncbi:hypothetical protein [Nocardia sp. NPDC005998]
MPPATALPWAGPADCAADGAAQINKLIDSLGDMAAVLNAGAPQDNVA